MDHNFEHEIKVAIDGLKENNFQYIITANKYEFVSDDEKEFYGNYDFDLSECIIATYKDIPQEMIFKKEY